MPSLKRVLFTTARIAVLVYVGFGLLLFFGQRSLLYYPSDVTFGDCSTLREAEAVTLPSGARGYWLEVPEAETIVVIYHGNAGSACDRAIYAKFFESLGLSTFIAEYAGYGSDSRGAPTQSRILADAEAVAAYINQKGFSRTILVGKSLGASVAAYHASLYAPNLLILVNPTVSIEKRAKELYPLYPVSLLLRERYDTLTWASKNTEVPIRLIHAGADELIPPHHSQELYEKLPQTDKTLNIIEGATHNTLPNFTAYWEALSEQ